MFSIYKEEVKRLIANIKNIKQSLDQKNIEIEFLTEKNRENEVIIKEKELIINDLEIKYKNLLNARELGNKLEGRDNAKAKINTLVREIDKCLALLND